MNVFLLWDTKFKRWHTRAYLQIGHAKTSRLHLLEKSTGYTTYSSWTKEERRQHAKERWMIYTLNADDAVYVEE